MQSTFDAQGALEAVRQYRHEPRQVLERCDYILHVVGLDKNDRAEAHLMKGAAFRAMGQLEAAELELQQALNIAIDTQDHSIMASSYLQQGAIKVEAHDFDSARKLLTIARLKFIQCGDLSGEANVLFSLASLLMLEKHYGSARLALDDALQRYSDVNNIEGMSQVIATSAVIYMIEGQYEIALEKLQDCERLFLDVGNKKNAIANALNRAGCYIKLENYSYATVLLTSTRERAKAHGFHVLEARALLGLANLSQRSGEVAESSSYHNQARELSIAHGFQPLFGALVADMHIG